LQAGGSVQALPGGGGVAVAGGELRMQHGRGGLLAGVNRQRAGREMIGEALRRTLQGGGVRRSPAEGCRAGVQGGPIKVAAKGLAQAQQVEIIQQASLALVLHLQVDDGVQQQGGVWRPSPGSPGALLPEPGLGGLRAGLLGVGQAPVQLHGRRRRRLAPQHGVIGEILQAVAQAAQDPQRRAELLRARQQVQVAHRARGGIRVERSRQGGAFQGQAVDAPGGESLADLFQLAQVEQVAPGGLQVSLLEAGLLGGGQPGREALGVPGGVQQRGDALRQGQGGERLPVGGGPAGAAPRRADQGLAQRLV